MYIPDADYDKILEMIPILCVDVVIVNQAKCLLLKRKNHPAKGQWWFPGGRMLKSETIEQAVNRKTAEEVNLQGQYLGILSIEETQFPEAGSMLCDIHTVNICCKMYVNSVLSLKVNDEHDGYKWVDRHEAADLILHKSVIDPLTLGLQIPSIDLGGTL
jgi:colanic acid biosynthesis protein WcaH